MTRVVPTAAIRRTALPALAGLCWLVFGSAGASDSATSPSPQAVIETRQQGFKKMGAAMKALNDLLKSDAPDLARMSAAAQAIASGAEAQARWFPADSGPDSGIDTDALPYIWENRERFDSIASQLVSESKTLAAAMSGNDMAALRTQVKTVSDVCSTCHRSFRAD